MKEVRLQTYSHHDSDPLLWPYLSADDDQQSQLALSELLARHAEPRINRILYSSKFRDVYGKVQTGQVDDARHDLYIHIISSLRNLKAKVHPQPISNFKNYVLVAAVNFCKDLLREKYKQRRKLRNKVHYLLATMPEFGIWEGEGNQMLCGFAGQLGQKAFSAIDCPLNLLELVTKDIHTKGILLTNVRKSVLPDLLSLIFCYTQGPILFKELVNITAALLGSDEHSEHREVNLRHELIEQIAHQQSDLAISYEILESLHRLWPEILLLPSDQRAALLYGLKDDQNRSGLMLLRLKGIASFSQIGAALDMSEQQLAEIWHELPLSDSEIGERLGLTRQQVGSSRMSARRRLMRRTKRLGL